MYWLSPSRHSTLADKNKKKKKKIKEIKDALGEVYVHLKESTVEKENNNNINKTQNKQANKQTKL